MADTFTDNLALVLPEIGASRNTWGTKTNDNWREVDRAIAGAMPIGAMVEYAGGVVDDGWLPCDGRALSRVTDAKLFAKIGTKWGAGDGSTTFNIPDTRGVITIGIGEGTDEGGVKRTIALAQRFGRYVVALLKTHLPKIDVGSAGAHAHSGKTDAEPNHTHTGATDLQGQHVHGGVQRPGGSNNLTGGQFPLNIGTEGNTNPDGIHAHNLTINPAGGHEHNFSTNTTGAHVHALGGEDTPHDNMPPVLGVAKIIFTGRFTQPARATP